VAEAPKPAIVPIAAAAPALAQAPKEAAKPPPLAKDESKPMAEQAPKPAEEASKPAATPPAAEAPREAPVVLPVVRGPSVPGPRFNDLMTAVLYRDAKAVDELIAFGKWPEKSDSRGITPLMAAALLGETGMAGSLLAAGANPNRPGPGGFTATSIARERSDIAMLKLLQSHGGK
jgi:hypothetical protein